MEAAAGAGVTLGEAPEAFRGRFLNLKDVVIGEIRVDDGRSMLEEHPTWEASDIANSLKPLSRGTYSPADGYGLIRW